MQSPATLLSELSNKQNRTTTAPALEHQGVLSDYDSILSHLRSAGTPSAKLVDVFIVPHIYSPLAQLGEPGRTLLKPLLDNPEYRAHCRQLEADPDTLSLTVEGNAVMHKVITADGKRQLILGLPGQSRANQRWIDLLVTINLAASKMGGEIRSDGALNLLRMLTYYGIAPWDLEAPNERASVTHILEEKRACHSLGLESGVDIDTLNRPDSTDPMTMDDLSPELTDRYIRNIISRFLPAQETSLIGHLLRNTLPTMTTAQIRATPTVCLEKVLKSPEAQKLGNMLLKGLNWYGAKPGEDDSPAARNKLISKAIRLWFILSKRGKPNDIAGYSWYQRSNWGKSYQTIRAEFEKHLVDSNRASSETEAILLARLFQTEFARDFQVPDIPPDLPYRGSVVWVNYVHGVTLAEAIEPGLIQRMTFQQLVDFPLQQSIQATDEELKLIAFSRIPPTLEWAITNGIILERADSDYSSEEYDSAVKALDEHTDALKKAITQLDVSPPERSAIAEREMKECFGPVLFISDGRKLIEDFGEIDGGGLIQTPPLRDKIYSFRDVYMSGKLTKNKNWFITTNNGKSRSAYRISINADRTIETTAPWIHRVLKKKSLPDAEEIFESEFKNYLEKSKVAYQTLLKSQFISLPYDDRQAIEHGEVKIYTLRKSTHEIELEDETPEMTLPLRLRMGFILQITYNANTSYYECLPRAGIIRRRPDFSSAMLNGKRQAQQITGSFLGQQDIIAVRRGKRVPFDWAAHEVGNFPKENATCDAIIDQFGETLTAPSINTESEQSSHPTLSFSRTSEIANFIARNFFYVDEKQLHAAAKSETEIERIAALPHWFDSVKGFLPFFGSTSDLLSSDPKKKAWGIFGLIVDVASFAFPLGKFVSGSLKLVSTAVRSSIRAALPKFGSLSQKLLISSIQNTIPFYGMPTLGVRLARGSLRELYAGVRFLLRPAYRGIQKAAGRAGKYSFIDGLAQLDNPGRWSPLAIGDQLATFKGIHDVPVRNIGSRNATSYRLVDPLSSKPFGPSLVSRPGQLSLGRSVYSALETTNSHAIVEIGRNARVQELLEVNGRTTMLIDDIPYRLDDDSLRRVSSLDASETLKQVPCRVRRAPGDTCKTKYVIADDPADTPAPGSFTEDKGWAPWFGDSATYPSTSKEGQPYELLAYEGKIYQHTQAGLKPYTGKPEWLGLTQKTPIVKASIPAKMQFQRGIYGRLQFTGTAEKIDDIHDVGAIIVYSKDKTKKYVFSRINTHDYYMAELLATDNIQSALTMKLLTDKQPLAGTLHEELLRVYTGSLNANNNARIHGVDKLERAMKKMEEIAIPIGTSKNPPDNMAWLSVDTASSEALMFDHQTRLIVSELPDGAALWKPHTGAPVDIQKSTADIFERLFTDRTIPITPPAKPTADAVKIDQAMGSLQDLLPQHKRTQNPRNIAFAEVQTAKGHREVYVSVSGAGDNTQHLPLFKSNNGQAQVELNSTTYFNIDNAKTSIEPSSLHMSSDGKLLAIPHTTNDPNRSDLLMRATSVDSESKLIGYIGKKYPDSKDIRSISVTTTLPPCDSCSIVMKEFGHERGASALNVTWGNRSNPLKRKADDTSNSSDSSSSLSTSSSSSPSTSSSSSD